MSDNTDGEEFRLYGGTFSMALRTKSALIFWLVAMANVVSVMALLGCSGGGGGRSLSHTKSEARPGDNFNSSATFEAAMPKQTASGQPHPAPESDSQYMPRSLNSGDTVVADAGSERDPFGYFPPEWPQDIALHPECCIGYSGEFGASGHYIVAFASSDLVTNMGIQTFHLDNLASWESLQVEEEPSDSVENGTRLIIIAGKEGAILRIESEQTNPENINTIPNWPYWIERVGVTPIVVRLYYTPVP